VSAVKESESELRAAANEAAALYGFEWMFVMPLRTKHGWRTPTYGPLGKGWTDTVYIHMRKGRTIYVEFKAEGGKVDPDQRELHRKLLAAGLEVYVVRPSGFDLFVRVLAGERMAYPLEEAA